MTDIAFVSLDDWCGIYIDGKLDAQNHSFSVSEIIERFCPEVHYIAADGTPLDEASQESGSLPETLKEVLDQLESPR